MSQFYYGRPAYKSRLNFFLRSAPVYDNVGAVNALRMLVFATQQNLALLARSNHWVMDGTFKVVPELFFQLYTIHALHNSQVIPCVYALLPNTQQPTSPAFLLVLRGARDNLNPESLLVEFELAALNALRVTFPDTALQGCLYHLSQCVYRHVQDAGLQAQCAAFDALSLATRMLVAIAFVPVNDIIDSFELLQEVTKRATSLTILKIPLSDVLGSKVST